MQYRTAVSHVIVVALGLLVVHSAPAAPSATRSTAALTMIRFAFDGRDRTALLLTPDGVPPTRGWPVVLLLHGAGGAGEQILNKNGWREVAMRERFVVIAPDGTPKHESRGAHFIGNPRTWNSGTGGGLATTARTAFAKRVNDVGYLMALLDTVAQRCRVDPSRVFVSGHSNGAGMSYRVAAEHPDRFAAVGVMAGHLFSDAPSRLASPVSLVQIVGDRDPVAPMAGGDVRTAASTLQKLRPALEPAQRWPQWRAFRVVGE
jgi:polyhydroxybutyrate depolymerase